MTRITNNHLYDYLSAWRHNPTLPLEVTRAKYDVPMPRSWEVFAWETPTCQVPIAEFTEWDEAQQWADKTARWAAERGVRPRRWIHGWVAGAWGGVAFTERLER